MAAEILRFATRDAWARAAAERLVAGLRDRPRAVFAGSGGSTPGPIYAEMACADLDWSRITVTLVDERFVPEASPESNAALLKASLPIGAGKANFLPLYHQAITVDRAAMLASNALRQRTDKLDTVLLGMGEDGHILSMFPGSPTLKTLLSPALPAAVLGVPKGREGQAPSRERLSMTLPFLMSAGTVVLALSGKEKRRVFEDQSVGDAVRLPVAALVAHVPQLTVLWTEDAR